MPNWTLFVSQKTNQTNLHQYSYHISANTEHAITPLHAPKHLISHVKYIISLGFENNISK